MQNALTLLTLSDGSIAQVQIAPDRGAIVTSFTVGGHELLYMDAATLADRDKNVRGGVPILFPIAGKLHDDRWQYGAHQGTMTQHGFARRLAWDVDSVRSDGEASTSRVSMSQVSMSVASSPATMSCYPWPFAATLTYSLKGACLRTTLTVRNHGDTAMPYALGFHPYFRVSDKRQLHIATPAHRAYNNVSKRQEVFSGFDFAAPEVDIHLLDHGADTAALRLSDGSLITVRASSDFGIWVVWTLAGKDFVCLEPWTALGNALNTRERLIEVPPGATHESWMEIAYTHAAQSS